MKLAAIVILYHPDEHVVENILSYAHKFESIYVYDNTENSLSLHANAIQQIPNVLYFSDNENGGIAKRLNAAAKMAIDEEFDWLLTMDQDSRFSKKAIDNYISCLHSFSSKNEVAMFGVEFEKEENDSKNCEYITKDYLITSGSMVNLQLFERIGGFDEALFIDEVDLEYCYRSIVKGYQIVQFTNVFLSHHLGTVNMFRSLKSGKKTPRSLHSPTRVYYMIRNFLYVEKLYKNRFIDSDKIRKKTLLNRIKNNFLYGNNRFFLLKMILKALSDYKKGKMGKIQL